TRYMWSQTVITMACAAQRCSSRNTPSDQRGQVGRQPLTQDLAQRLQVLRANQLADFRQHQLFEHRHARAARLESTERARSARAVSRSGRRRAGGAKKVFVSV